jgi:pantoate--beta-alanine ligase
MDIVSTIAAIRERTAAARTAGHRVALVPTMGALHEGHLALVDAARREADLVVVSLFVNPLQFRPGEDFERYPRPLDRDLALAEARGAAVVFAPDVSEMYGSDDEIRVVPGATAARWEGEFRPGHFDGVLTVVAKLFNIVRPDVACFGRKDLQQVVLVGQMVEELDIPVRLVVVPTVRDADGLALSSRNAFLSPAERATALALPGALAAVVRAWRGGESDGTRLAEAGRRVLEAAPGLMPDYIAVVDRERLRPVEHADAGSAVVVAARVGATRLIDNTILGEEDV